MAFLIVHTFGPYGRMTFDIQLMLGIHNRIGVQWIMVAGHSCRCRRRRRIIRQLPFDLCIAFMDLTYAPKFRCITLVGWQIDIL